MLRMIVGLIKGLIVGGAVGYGLLSMGVGMDDAVSVYAACALVGAVVGVVCGKAPWRSETLWTPAVKAIAGGLIGAGLCALGRKFLPAGVMIAHLQGHDLRLGDPGPLAALIGAIYGMFVEIDDGGKVQEPPAPRKAIAPPKE